MPGTTCREAIKKWQEEKQQDPAEAEEVLLCCQIPFIERLDDSLNQLENVEKLSLSTNSIDKMIALPKLRKIKILSLGRNNIKRIAGLDEIGQTLEQLWISYNQIEKLDGLTQCIKLKTLFASNNRVKNWDDVGKLALLPELKIVVLVGNPIYGTGEKKEWAVTAAQVVKKIPNIEYVDNFAITKTVKQMAAELD